MTAIARAQVGSAGGSTDAIVEAALAAARPAHGLSWLDIGCGTGALLRTIRDRHEPAELRGIDVVDFLAGDLRPGVSLEVGPAETLLEASGPADRVMLVEVIEHLESPWTVLRLAARRVAPHGTIVVTTPNVASLRHRLELLVRGRLTSFRPDHPPHLTPALPHVIARILAEEGLTVAAPSFIGGDIVPLTSGRSWPRAAAARRPQLANVSVLVSASRR